MNKKAKSVVNENNNDLCLNVINQNDKNTQSDSIFSFSNEENSTFKKEENLIDQSDNSKSILKLKANLDPKEKDDKSLISPLYHHKENGNNCFIPLIGKYESIKI